jgi:hypothetical protein
MKPLTIHGLKCARWDEKTLVTRVNDFLAMHRRTMSKSKNQSLLASFTPYVLRHFYWNLNKEMGTFFEIYPNEDAQGEYFFPGHPECGWLLFVKFDAHGNADIVKEKSEGFIAELLRATGYERVVIRERDDLKVGLARGEKGSP